MNKTLKNISNVIIKYIISGLAGVGIFFLIVVIPSGIAETIDNNYSMNGVITEINSAEILVEDITGNIWAFEGHGYIVGENVRVSFFNNHTDNIRTDDEIIKVTKIK